MTADVIECDRCPATLYVGDGTLIEVSARVRSAGWTTPTPFTDRCPTCSAAEAVQDALPSWHVRDDTGRVLRVEHEMTWERRDAEDVPLYRLVPVDETGESDA